MFKLSILALISAFFGFSALASEDADIMVKAQKLIPKLGGKNWKDREKAQEQIILLFAEKGQPVVSTIADGVLRVKDPEIKMRLESLLKRMAPDHVRTGERGFIGISLAKLHGPVKVGDAIYHPIDIVNVLHGSVGRAAGLIGGERILSMDEVVVTADVSVADAVSYISSRGPGAELKLTYLTRDKKVKVLGIVLGKRIFRPGDLVGDAVRDYMMKEWLATELRRATLRSEETPAKK